MKELEVAFFSGLINEYHARRDVKEIVCFFKKQ